MYKEPRTCKPCEDKHGKIYPFNSLPYIPEHLRCRCEIVPMRTIKVGEAISAEWISFEGNLNQVCPEKIICNKPYRNREAKLPNKAGRQWFEADFDYDTDYRGENRILYSSDGLIFVSYDHAKTFYELVKRGG